MMTKDTSDTVEARIAAALNSPQHAPMSDHHAETGECVSCPWPLHMLGPDEIARVVATQVFGDQSAEQRLDALASDLRALTELDAPVAVAAILAFLDRYSPRTDTDALDGARRG